MSESNRIMSTLVVLVIVILVTVNFDNLSNSNLIKTNEISTSNIHTIAHIRLNPLSKSSGTAIIGNVTTSAPSFLIVYDSYLNWTYSYSSTGTLFVISDYTNSVIANLSVGPGSNGMIYDPSNGYIYLSNLMSGNITMIYGTTILSSIFLGFDSYPTSMIYDPADSLVYVAFTSFYLGLYAFPEVAVISGNQIIDYWSYAGQLAASTGIYSFQRYYTQNLTFDPSNGNIYVSNEQLGVVAIYGEQNLISVLPDPVSMAYDPVNQMIYVASGSPGTVQVIGASDSLVTTITGILGDNYSVTPFLFDPASNDMLVLDQSSGSIYALNSSNGVVANISSGRATDGIYDPANRLVYVGSLYSNELITINGSLSVSNLFLVQPSVVTSTASMALGRDSGELYLANSNANFITVIGSWVYPVTFTSSGLPLQTSCGSPVGWSINLAGNVKNGNATTPIQYLEVNGTYAFTASSTGFVPTPATGTVIVSGGTSNNTIYFYSGTTFGIHSQLSFSDMFLKGFHLNNLIELNIGIGLERPYSVIGIDGNSTFNFTETNCSLGTYQTTIDMGSLAQNAFTIMAYFNNTTMNRSFSLNLVNEPYWLSSLISIGYDYVTFSNYEWNNTYSIFIDDSLPFSSLFGINVNMPFMGGQYGFFPNVGSSVLINSDGSIVMNSHISSPSLSIAGVSTNSISGIPITFSLELTGQFSVSNGNITWISSNMTVSVSGSVSIPIPIVGYSFSVPDVGTVNIGLSLTITVTPTFVLSMVLAPTNSSSYQFISNLDMMIKSISTQIGVAVSAAINAGIGIASISGGGALTFNFNLSISPSPLTLSGNVYGSLFVNWNALIWSGTIWSAGPYSLFSWGPNTLSHISRITHNASSGNASNFTLTPRYYNTSNYQSYRWINGQWNGTAINDINPHTRIASSTQNNSTYLLYSYDNVSISERHGLGIHALLSNSSSRNISEIASPTEKGFIITNPQTLILQNGSMAALWIAVPYNDTNVSNPFLVKTVLLQYSILNTTSLNWSSPINITHSGIANSYSLAKSGGTIYVVVLWSSNATSPSYLKEYAMTKYPILVAHSDVIYSTLNLSLPNAVNIVSFRINNSGLQYILLQFENGSYEIAEFRSGLIGPPTTLVISQLPSLNGYSIKQAGLADNASNLLFVLYSNSSFGDLFAVYNITNFSSPSFIANLMIRLPVSTSEVRLIYGNGTSFLGVSTLDQAKYLDKLQVFCLGALPGWISKPDTRNFFNFTVLIRNITFFDIEKTMNAIVSFSLSNYGNTSQPLLNLVVTYDAIVPPPSPTLQITGSYQHNISLSWSVLGGSEYNIQRYLLNSSINGVPYLSLVLPNTTTSYSFHTIGQGEYKFWVYAIDPFGQSPRSNYASISYYNVTFVGLGLPSGSLLYVDLNGTIGSGTNKVVFSVPNGTYAFRASSNSSLKANPSFGYVTVSGYPTITYIFFTSTTAFSVNFTETGLPSGYQWSLSNGKNNYVSSFSSIVLYLSNGTYSFTPNAINYAAYPSSINVVVNGQNENQLVTFASPYTPIYNISFVETGLNSGTQWGIYLNNNLATSISSSISIYESDGTYHFSVKGVSGYSPSPQSGNVSVNGKNVIQNIYFSTKPIYWRLSFTISGMATGSSWSVHVGNKSIQSNTLNISLLLLPGIYNYTIAPISGYKLNTTSGTVDLTKNITVHILATKKTQSSTFIFYYIVPTIIIIIVALSVIFMKRKTPRNKNQK